MARLVRLVWVLAVLVSIASLSARAAAQTLGPPLSVGQRFALTGADDLRFDAIAYDGAAFVLAYGDSTTGDLSKLVRVGIDGTVTPLGIELNVLDLACSDGVCLATGGRRVTDELFAGVATRFRVNGELIDATPLELRSPAPIRSADLIARVDATDDGRFVVAVATRIAGSSIDVVAVSRTGPISSRTMGVGTLRLFGVDIACGSSCLLTWHASLGVYARPFDAAGSPMSDAVPVVVSGVTITEGLAVVHDGRDFRLAQHGVGGEGFALTLDAAGSVRSSASTHGFHGQIPRIGCLASRVCLMAARESGTMSWRDADLTHDGGATRVAVLACGGEHCIAFYDRGWMALRGHVIMVPSLRPDIVRTVDLLGPDHVQHGPLSVAGELVAFQRERYGSNEVVVIRNEELGAEAVRDYVVWTAPERVQLQLAGRGLLHALAIRESGGTSSLMILDPRSPAAASFPTGCRHGLQLAWHDEVLGVACETDTALVLERRDYRDSRGGVLDITVLGEGEARHQVGVAASARGWRVVVVSHGQLMGYEVAVDGTVAMPGGTRLTASSVRPGSARITELGEGHLVGWMTEDGTTRLSAWPESSALLATPEGIAVPLAISGGAYELSSWGRVAYLAARVPHADGTVSVHTLAVREGAELASTVTAFTSSVADPDTTGIAVGGVPPVVLYTTRIDDPEWGLTLRVQARRIETDGVCARDTDCAEGRCVEGFCCVCDVCGTCTAGVCAPRARGDVCRAATSACDVAELCDGTTVECPDDFHTCLDDAGTLAVDAGLSATSDAGPPTDAGLTRDASAMHDASAMRDASPITWPDGGAFDDDAGTITPAPGSCGCRTQTVTARKGLAAMVLLVFAVLARRRRPR